MPLFRFQELYLNLTAHPERSEGSGGNFLRFFADAQNDTVGVGGFRRPKICHLLSVVCCLNCVVGGFRRPIICHLPSVICYLNCHPERSEGSGCKFLHFCKRTTPPSFCYAKIHLPLHRGGLCLCKFLASLV